MHGEYLSKVVFQLLFAHGGCRMCPVLVTGGVTQTLCRPWKDPAHVKADTSIQLNCSPNIIDWGTKNSDAQKGLWSFLGILWLWGWVVPFIWEGGMSSNKAHSCHLAYFLCIFWRRIVKISIDPWTGIAAFVSQQQRMLENQHLWTKELLWGCPVQLLLAEMSEESLWNHL